MKCVGCGTELAEGALICAHCGRAVQTEDVVRQKAASGQLTKKEFYELAGMKSIRGNIKGCAIVLYVCAGITILAAVVLQGFLSASLIDGILLLGLGLWLQFGKSRVCAIITFLYGLLGTGLTLVQTGRVQGWWIPLAGVWAITYTFKFYKLWNQYRKSGVVPDEAISE
ncbi:MAG: hypothetical protein HFH85_14655 [Lachnospiraceae bacterium]|nr:hypothetical protein [Lachnospiraceae bacterium]